MKNNSVLRLVVLFGSLFLTQQTLASGPSRTADPLDGKVIILDPGHGGTAATDSYRVGPSGEREEWVNLRVALVLKDLLEAEGAKVVLTRDSDTFVPLEDRSRLALESNGDLFLSIHHNATADPSVNFPIIYFHGAASENQASVLLGKKIALSLRKHLFAGKGPFSLVSDYTIFSKSGASVLRGTYGMPAVIGEATFFTHPKEEKRLKKQGYNRKEARAYLEAIRAFFSENRLPVLEKSIPLRLEPFDVFQEAERMRPEALRWKENFEEARRLVQTGDAASRQQALSLLNLSVRAFPDSYLARQCHELRVAILEAQGKTEEAAMETKRIQAFYPR
ncbi:N-acetylmuramoyl-L-alanine amidase [Cyclobacterium xiamenense]|uniref:N-acetylmuramoyl-L-alanine amidase family protein n=1 Tax=Cyclobacterium xiamenense TaxID=1297121 RepID=UPI0035D0214C